MLKYCCRFFLLVGSLYLSFSVSAAELKVSMINVGSADSILIETPEGKRILIDGGTASGGEQKVVPFLQNKGIKKLDTVLLTHHHPDHYEGLYYVVKNFEVGEFYDTDSARPRKYQDLIRLIQTKKISRKIPKVGDDYDWGGVKAHILSTYDPEAIGAKDPNNNSIVLKLVYGKTSFLFTGDLEETGETHLVNEKADLKADVLKCPHHGIEYSSTYPFLRAVDPQVVFVPAGNLVPYILERYRMLGVQFYRTNLDGNIEISSDGEKLSVKTELNPSISVFTALPHGQLTGENGVFRQPFKKGGGIRRVAYYRNGKFDGSDVEYHGNKKPRIKANWKQNLLDGNWEYFSSEGERLATIPYKNGKREGLAQLLNSNGKAWGESVFKDGEPQYSKLFYENGQVWRQIDYDENHIGHLKDYSEDGKLLASRDIAETSAKEVSGATMEGDIPNASDVPDAEPDASK